MHFISGQFLWTGMDYLGEAGAWPNRANGAGLLDLCGFKKPLAWFRQSLWSDKPMVYLCVGGFGGDSVAADGAASVAWKAGIGRRMPPSACNVMPIAPKLTLTLNGKIIGTKKLSEAVNGVLRWQVPFEPGDAQSRWPCERAGRLRLRLENRRSAQPD